MRHFTSVADVITRQEYFVVVVDAIQRADSNICGSVTGSKPAPEENEVVNQILGSIRDASKRGVKIRYILPLASDKLTMAKNYIKNGAEIRFNPSLLASDARYMCVDGKLSIIGVPERRGQNEPTRKGYSIPSESITQLLLKNFEELWNSGNSKTYHDYLKELVQKARSTAENVSPELIASNLDLEPPDIKSVFDRQAISSSRADLPLE
jgi:hypothetical protein